MDRNTKITDISFWQTFASSLRVVIVGTGALGSAVCRLLMLRGHAEVLLVDPDTVAPHNLALSRLFREAGHACVGREKVEVIRELADARGLEWRTVQAEIADVGLGRLARYDLLISCTDSALARVETAFAARSLRLPMLDGGVQSRQIPEGRVSWFDVAEASACYLCGLPENRRGELLAYALAPSLGCLIQGETEAMTGAMTMVEAVAETLVAVLATPACKESFALRLHDGQEDERIDLTPSVTCPWHDLPAPGKLVSLPYDDPMSASIPKGGVLEFAWPVCLRARCGQCGAVCEPGVRAARVRRTLRCSGCGNAGCLQPLETIEKLTASHPLAGRTPRQLGLAEEHLYHQRSGMFAIQPFFEGAPEVFQGSPERDLP